MDGLAILSQHADLSVFSRLCFLLATPFVVLGIIFVASYFIDDSTQKKLLGIGAFLLLIGVTFVWLGVRSPRDIVYEAYADETVTFDEITDHYKIIDVDGKLLTLEEIENDG